MNLSLSAPKKSDYDVVILGGGWAGLTLARQLKLGNENLSILVSEAQSTFRSKVGEATVEMTGHYFMKQLGLVNYLYRNHLPKNGLRLFYDSANHDLALHELSEHGTTSIPPHPAFQLDRAILESDLVNMNQEQGIEVLMGTKATDFSLTDDDERHTVQLENELGSFQLSAKWVVDCSGRHRITRKHKKLSYQKNVPENFSAWARFKNVKDIDSLGTSQWQQKAFGRFLSTNHFTGDGYWVWFIPLSGGYTSVGIVGEKSKFPKPPTKQADFLAFLHDYKAIHQLLDGAEIVDFEAWGQLAYRADEFIFSDRWATSGFASMFLDPLFSGGGDMIALFNDQISQAILTDIATGDRAQAQTDLDNYVPVANQTVREFFQGLYAHVANVYPVIDCGELCSPLLAYNTAAYFLEIAWDYMAGHYANQEYWLRKSYLRRGYMALELILQRQILDAEKILKQQDRYYRRNSENFFESGADLYKYFVYQMGQTGKDGWRIDLRIKLWTDIFLRITQAKLDLPMLASRMIVQNSITLIDILEKPLMGEPDEEWLFTKVSEKLTEMTLQVIAESDMAIAKGISFQVNRSAFTTGKVLVCDPQQKLSDDELTAVSKKANMLWAQSQEYIAMPSMVPVFLGFARQQPDSIMTTIVDQRRKQVATESELAEAL